MYLFVCVCSGFPVLECRSVMIRYLLSPRPADGHPYVEHCPGGELLQTHPRLQGLCRDLPGAGGRRDSPPPPHARVPRQVPGHQARPGAEDHAARGVASVAAR